MPTFLHRPAKSDPAAITLVQVDRFIRRMQIISEGNARTLLWLEDAQADKGLLGYSLASSPSRDLTTVRTRSAPEGDNGREGDS